MDQLSLPYRIALVALLVVGAVCLVVLKPSGDPVAPPVTPAATATPAPASKPTTDKPSAPGVSGLSSAVGKARGAVTAQSGSDAATATAAAAAGETTTGAAVPGAPVAIGPVRPVAGATTASTAAGPAQPAAAGSTATTTVKPIEPAMDPSTTLLAALDRGRTVVVLFAGRTAADDLAVRRALRRTDRRGGKVQVHVAPLARVGDYEAITRGVQVQQSPTLLVIGKSRTAREIVGFTTTREIDQLVTDVRRG